MRRSRERPLSVGTIGAPQRPRLRLIGDLCESFVELGHQLDAEACPLRLVPLCSARGFLLGLREDDDASAHRRASRSKMRARTSLHSGAGAPRVRAAATRRSSSASHAASQSGSGVPSTLAMRSEASLSRSATGSPTASARRSLAGRLTTAKVAQAAPKFHPRARESSSRVLDAAPTRQRRRGWASDTSELAAFPPQASARLGCGRRSALAATRAGKLQTR
jgi:hypothetical protein